MGMEILKSGSLGGEIFLCRCSKFAHFSRTTELSGVLSYICFGGFSSTDVHIGQAYISGRSDEVRRTVLFGEPI